MKTKTQTLAMAVCFALVLIQFASCKKDAANSETAKNIGLVQNDTTVNLDSGLIGWYTFNGDTRDHSGYRNNVVFNSAQAVAGKAGIPKTAYRFTNGSYMLINNNGTLNPNRITLYAVFKPLKFYSGSCHYNTLISKGFDFNSNGRYGIGFTDQYHYNFAGCNEPDFSSYQSVYGAYGDGGSAAGAIDTAHYVSLNEWYSFAYTYNGFASKIYVNGALVYLNHTTSPFTKNGNNIYIGKEENPSYPYNFTGVVDEIRIYKRALNITEIKALYNSEN